MIFSVIPVKTISTPNDKWNNDWNFFQEITIPIDTLNRESLLQPIDQEIQFNKPCWGTDETIHSIRIISYHDRSWKELESQIYNIELKDESTITLVELYFLSQSLLMDLNYITYIMMMEKN